jgi:SAM-dependent methyltransferase
MDGYIRNAQTRIINKRYAGDQFNVVHEVPKGTLIGNLSHLVDLEELRGKTILEIGAGCSNYLALFLEFGVEQLLANDLVERRLKLNDIKDPRYLELPGDFLEINFAEYKVDIIFSHLTYMFMVPILNEMFLKARAVLKPGGLLITIDPNYICPISLYRYFVGRGELNPARLFNPFKFAKITQVNGLTVDRLVPFTSNQTWATGHWLLGTCFGMRAVKLQ